VNQAKGFTAVLVAVARAARERATAAATTAAATAGKRKRDERTAITLNFVNEMNEKEPL
jgi:hypothetical protein